MIRGRRNSPPSSARKSTTAKAMMPGWSRAGWDQPSFSDSRWGAVAVAPAPPAPLVAQDFQPIRVNEILKPQDRYQSDAREFTSSISARTWWAGRGCTFPARLEPKSRMRFGEVLKPNGELYTENLRTAEATDTYILRGKGSETFRASLYLPRLSLCRAYAAIRELLRRMRSKASSSTPTRPSPFNSAPETRW